MVGVHRIFRSHRSQRVSIGVKTGILASELLERPLTEAQPPTIKVGATYQGRFSAQSRVPFIRMAGRWLTEAGFLEGDVLRVSVGRGESGLRGCNQCNVDSPEVSPEASEVPPSRLGFRFATPGGGSFVSRGRQSCRCSYG